MSVKPTQAEGLNRVWSETGGRTDPDTITPGKVATGWVAEIPPFQFMNWAQHFSFKMCNHVNVEGVPIWDATTTYNLHSYAKSAVDGNMYRSNVASNQGNEPSASTQWDIFDSAGASDTDELTNASAVAGATCSDALNTLQSATNANASAIGGLDSTDVANISGVAGSSVTAALNTLNSNLGSIDSTDVTNVSGVSGASVTAALNTLNSDIGGLDSTDIANVSSLSGANLTAVLNGLDSGDIANDSTVAGATVTDALNALDGAGGGSINLVRNIDVSNFTTTDAPFLPDQSLQASTHYIIEGFLRINGVQTEGCVLTIAATGLGDIAAFFNYSTNNTNPVPVSNRTSFSGISVTIPSSEVSATGFIFVEFKGSFFAGATPGNLEFDFRKVAVVSQALTIDEGSWVRLTPSTGVS